MHRSLRPGGALLDLHPQPEPYRKVEVRIRARRAAAGRLYREPFFLADIEAARRSLDAAVSEGRYRVEEELAFDYVEHYDSTDAWEACLVKPRVGALVAADDLLESACALMPEGEGEIVVTQRERAARFLRSE